MNVLPADLENLVRCFILAGCFEFLRIVIGKRSLDMVHTTDMMLSGVNNSIFTILISCLIFSLPNRTPFHGSCEA